MSIKFGTFFKKDEYPDLIISEIIDSKVVGYLNVETPSTCASEHHSVINVWNGFKHCWNQHGTTIILFSNEFEIYWVGESRP